MMNLLMLLLFTLLLTAPCCCEGASSKAVDEGIKIGQEKANTFVRRQKRAYPYSERYYEMFKSPMEMKQEQCEHYAPCNYYSEIVDFLQHIAITLGTSEYSHFSSNWDICKDKVWGSLRKTEIASCFYFTNKSLTARCSLLRQEINTFSFLSSK